MASLTVGKKNKTGDEWFTPKSAFQDIAHLISKDKVIWEPFYGDGSSGKYLTELGFEVIHEPLDFFEQTNFDYDIIVSNPPFSKKIAIFKHLAKLDKPFILLVPVSIITKQYLKKYFKDKVQIIIPKSRIHFLKNGQAGTGCWFDTIFIAYRMNLEKDITYL
jgi:hypothetical protein